MRKKKKNAILNYLSILFIAFIGAAVVLGGYFVFFDANPPVKIAEPLPITPNTAVYPGDTVIMTSSFCKYTSASSLFTAYWQNEDGLIWGLTTKQLTASEKGCFSVDIPLVIPLDIPPGSWRRVNTGEYEVNLLATRSVTWRSEKIEVIGH